MAVRNVNSTRSFALRCSLIGGVVATFRLLPSSVERVVLARIQLPNATIISKNQHFVKLLSQKEADEVRCKNLLELSSTQAISQETPSEISTRALQLICKLHW